MDDVRPLALAQLSKIDRAIERHARLAVLRHLADAPAYSLNKLVLRDLLDADFMMLSMQRLEAILIWLKQEGLLDLGTGNGIVGAELLDRGLDVADGRAMHEGIARPPPRG